MPDRFSELADPNSVLRPANRRRGTGIATDSQTASPTDFGDDGRDVTAPMRSEAMEYYPMIQELKPNQIEMLRTVTTDNLSIGEVGCFTDDHLPCVNTMVNEVKVSFWWLEPQAAAAFFFQDSPTARGIIVDLIRETVEAEEGGAA